MKPPSQDRRRAQPIPIEQRPHGTRSTYLYGCRCEPCRNANAESARQQRRRTAKAKAAARR